MIRPEPARPRRLRALLGRLRLGMLLLSTLLTVMFLSPAGAQQMTLSGVWYCTYGVRDTSPQQRPTVFMEFQMEIMGNGTVRAQGVMASGAGQFPMQIQGNWTVQGSTFTAQGQISESLGTFPFAFASDILGPMQMSSTIQVPDGNIIATSCQRVA